MSMHYLPYYTLMKHNTIKMSEPPRWGQPPNKGQKARSQSVLCSEAQLYMLFRVGTLIGKLSIIL